MQYDPDDILSFAEMITNASLESEGQEWTPREIDGFFYFRYLNQELSSVVNQLRMKVFQQESPPYPAQWGVGVYSKNQIAGSDEAGWIRVLRNPVSEVTLDLNLLHERFGIDVSYLKANFLNGTPVAFSRIAVKLHHEESPSHPLFRLDIFGPKVTQADWKLIRIRYEDWLLTMEPRLNDIAGAALQNVPDAVNGMRARFLKNGVPHIEVMSGFPYASRQVFEATAKEQFRQHRNRLSGKGSPALAIRAWTVYLLADKCGLTARESITQVNKRIGSLRGIGVYKMEEPSNDAEDHTGNVTSSGEIQFSGDKAELEKRIGEYDRALANTEP